MGPAALALLAALAGSNGCELPGCGNGAPDFGTSRELVALKLLDEPLERRIEELPGEP